jgi:hypothetical protein
MAVVALVAVAIFFPPDFLVDWNKTAETVPPTFPPPPPRLVAAIDLPPPPTPASVAPPAESPRPAPPVATEATTPPQYQAKPKTAEAETDRSATTAAESELPSPAKTAEPPDPADETRQLADPIEKKLDEKEPRDVDPDDKKLPVDLSSVLPRDKAAEYEELVAEGLALRKKGIRAPEYNASMPTEEIDRILDLGLARLAVVSPQTNQWFLVGGTLGQPGRPRLAHAEDFGGFSQRTISLTGLRAKRVKEVVGRDFACSSDRLLAALVLRADLDAGVLAAQHRAAESLSIPFENVATTEGSFKSVDGFPFAYRVRSLTTRDGDQRLLALAD